MALRVGRVFLVWSKGRICYSSQGPKKSFLFQAHYRIFSCRMTLPRPMAEWVDQRSGSGPKITRPESSQAGLDSTWARLESVNYLRISRFWTLFKPTCVNTQSPLETRTTFFGWENMYYGSSMRDYVDLEKEKITLFLNYFNETTIIPPNANTVQTGSPMKPHNLYSQYILKIICTCIQLIC